MRKFYLISAGLLVGLLTFGSPSYAANYTVNSGDTLYRIARNHTTTVNTLISLNNLNSTTIYPGQTLQLPDNGQAPSASQYTVQPGDTLYLISKAYATTVDEIMSLNNLCSSEIYPGQVLQLPGSGQAPAPQPKQHTVNSGDTLYLISKTYATTVDEIMSLNNLNSSMIYPGEVLRLPDYVDTSSQQSPDPSPVEKQYTVKPGDTLYFISQTYGISVDEIMALNNLSSTEIYPGQVLRLQGTSSTTSSTTPSRGSYSSEDTYLLAQIISAEAAGESFEGQVAVGAVILNRIPDPRFPNNLWDVIYEPWQFEPVQNGTINLPPTASAIRAAEGALSGWDPVDGAVYFCNPATAQSTAFFRTLTYICRIGNHVFYR